jgi:hypothetical protein
VIWVAKSKIQNGMTLFSAKSIGLYSLAIGSAIGFFNIVTSYGEANIKAPLLVTGNYLITSPNLPDCFQQKQLILKIQQSGIYLNGSIATASQIGSNNNETRPTFSGRLQDRQLELSGRVPPDICPQGSQLKITSTIAKIGVTDTKKPLEPALDRQLQGQLWLTNLSNQTGKPIAFTGILQPSTQSAESH